MRKMVETRKDLVGENLSNLFLQLHVVTVVAFDVVQKFAALDARMKSLTHQGIGTMSLQDASYVGDLNLLCPYLRLCQGSVFKKVDHSLIQPSIFAGPLNVKTFGVTRSKKMWIYVLRYLWCSH